MKPVQVAVSPCDNCPFLKTPYFHLHPGRRREFVRSLRAGESFMCHKTLTSAMRRGKRSRICVGALATMSNEGTVMESRNVQVLTRLGLLKLELRHPERCYPSLEAFENATTAMTTCLRCPAEIVIPKQSPKSVRCRACQKKRMQAYARMRDAIRAAAHSTKQKTREKNAEAIPALCAAWEAT